MLSEEKSSLLLMSLSPSPFFLSSLSLFSPLCLSSSHYTLYVLFLYVNIALVFFYSFFFCIFFFLFYLHHDYIKH